MCVYSKLPYEIEANVQQKISLIFTFHITRSLNPPALKTHYIFLSCHHNYFSMACKLLCESWRPLVFMLKSCHLMDFINTAAAPCLLFSFLLSWSKADALPAPESSARLSQPCHRAASLVTMEFCQCSKLQG